MPFPPNLKLANLKKKKKKKRKKKRSSVGAMAIVDIFNIMICNKIKDTFPTNSLILYINKEIAAQSSKESIINDCNDLKKI